MKKVKKAILFIPNVLYFFIRSIVEITKGSGDWDSAFLKMYVGVYVIIDLFVLLLTFSILPNLPVYQIVLLFLLTPLAIFTVALCVMSIIFGGVIPHKFGILWVNNDGKICKVK